MVDVQCASCEKKGCCTYPGWKVFFTAEERRRVGEQYGDDEADKIKEFYGRSNGQSVYAVTLPCPFFERHSGKCRIYQERPLACRVFPVEIEPITGATYLDQAVCPERHAAKVNADLVQINVKKWCEQFWQASSKQEVLHEVPIADQGPQGS